jgi:L-lactate dehydrogenase complex protein LldE
MPIMGATPEAAAGSHGNAGWRARPDRVQLLVTCLIDQFFPDTGMSVVRVLERLGLTVEFPAGQTCCGQPAFNAGFVDEARDMARHTIDVLSKSDAPVVIPSGSCGDMVIHHAAKLLENDPRYGPKAAELASRTFEFTQFLVDVLGVTDVGATVGASAGANASAPAGASAGQSATAPASPGLVTYHASCHGLRGLGVKAQPAALLEHVRGIQRCPLPESEVCCGFGGLFAVKMSEISAAMLGRKLDSIDSTNADTVVVTDVSCAMHMNGGLHRRGGRARVIHLADLLASGDSSNNDHA